MISTPPSVPQMSTVPPAVGAVAPLAGLPPTGMDYPGMVPQYNIPPPGFTSFGSVNTIIYD